MIYVLVPHRAQSRADVRYFTTFACAEQAVFLAAQGYASQGEDPDWCTLTAYEGVDELHPVFLYTLIAPGRLHREPYPSPSP